MRRFLCFVILLAPGCHIPDDVESTTERVRGGVLRVGYCNSAPWAYGQDHPRGVEVELINELARQLHTTVHWFDGPESVLFEQLHRGQLDLVIGGVTDDTPWSGKVGLTEWYVQSRSPVTGEIQSHVWATPPGENQWLTLVDRFLQQERTDVPSKLREALGEQYDDGNVWL